MSQYVYHITLQRTRDGVTALRSSMITTQQPLSTPEVYKDVIRQAADYHGFDGDDYCTKSVSLISWPNIDDQTKKINALTGLVHALMALNLNGHQLCDRLQFSPAGRDLLKVYKDLTKKD